MKFLLDSPYTPIKSIKKSVHKCYSRRNDTAIVGLYFITVTFACWWVMTFVGGTFSYEYKILARQKVLSGHWLDAICDVHQSYAQRASHVCRNWIVASLRNEFFLRFLFVLFAIRSFSVLMLVKSGLGLGNGSNEFGISKRGRMRVGWHQMYPQN